MEQGWIAFRTGLERVRRYWPVMVILFGTNILSASLLTIFPALQVLSRAYQPAFRQVADGVDGWLWLESLLSISVDTTLGSLEPGAALKQVFLLALGAVAGAVVLSWLTTTFLSGGVWLTYAEAPAPFRWQRFLWGGWHWFSAFWLLGTIQSVIALVIMLPLGLLALGLTVKMRWLAWIFIPLGALLGIAWLVLGEYSGAFMVLKGTRNPFKALGEAMRYGTHRPLAIATLYGVTLLLLALINGFYYFGLTPVLPLTWWPLVIAAAQAFVIVRLLLRLARWAGSLAMIEQDSSDQQTVTPAS